MFFGRRATFWRAGYDCLRPFLTLFEELVEISPLLDLDADSPGGFEFATPSDPSLSRSQDPLRRHRDRDTQVSPKGRGSFLMYFSCLPFAVAKKRRLASFPLPTLTSLAIENKGPLTNFLSPATGSASARLSLGGDFSLPLSPAFLPQLRPPFLLVCLFPLSRLFRGVRAARRLWILGEILPLRIRPAPFVLGNDASF